MYVSLNLFPVPCANLSSSLENYWFQTFSCFSYFIRCLYSIPDTISWYMMVFATFCSWYADALFSNLYWIFVTPRLKNRCLSYICVDFSKNSFIPLGSYWVSFLGACILWCKQMVWWVQDFCVPTLGYVTVIICAILGGVVVSTLGGSVSPTLRPVGIFTTLGGAPGLFGRS